MTELTLDSYVQFHQLTYLLKLYIEMNVASLLGHIVKGSRDNDGRGGRYGHRTHDESSNVRMATLITANRMGHVRLDDDSSKGTYPVGSQWGIHKKVETEVVFTEAGDGKGSETGSEAKVLA